MGAAHTKGPACSNDANFSMQKKQKCCPTWASASRFPLFSQAVSKSRRKGARLGGCNVPEAAVICMVVWKHVRVETANNEHYPSCAVGV